jgi:DNA polymerase I
VDNIPGVPGVGHKTAATLMREFESLEALYSGLERVAALRLRGQQGICERLREHREAAFLARRLTRISCDLSLGVEPEGLRRRAPDVKALGTLYDRLGFGPFLRRQSERLAAMPMN